MEYWPLLSEWIRFDTKLICSIFRYESSITLLSGLNKKYFMCIDIAHRKLTTLVFIGLLGMVAVVGAEPVIGQSMVQSPPESGDELAEVSSQPMDIGAVEGSKKNPAGANSAQESPPLTGRSNGPIKVEGDQIIEPPVSLVVASANIKPHQSGRDLRSALEETTRPLYEELASSDAADALRSLNKTLSFSDSGSSDFAHTGRHGIQTESDSLDSSGNRYSSQNRTRSGAQIEADQVIDSILIDELIQEVKPWIFGLV